MTRRIHKPIGRKPLPGSIGDGECHNSCRVKITILKTIKALDEPRIGFGAGLSDAKPSDSWTFMDVLYCGPIDLLCYVIRVLPGVCPPGEQLIVGQSLKPFIRR